MARRKKRNGQMREIWNGYSAKERLVLIVDVALKLLVERGIEHVSMRKIAFEIGIGTMTLYTYISSLDELMLLITERGFQLLENAVATARDYADSDDVLKRSQAGIRGYLKFAMDNPELYELMFRHPLMGLNDETTRERFYPYFMGFMQHHEEILRAEGVDPETARKESVIETGIRWSFVHGLASLCIAKRIQFVPESPERLLAIVDKRLYPVLFAGADADDNAPIAHGGKTSQPDMSE